MSTPKSSRKSDSVSSLDSGFDGPTKKRPTKKSKNLTQKGKSKLLSDFTSTESTTSQKQRRTSQKFLKRNKSESDYETSIPLIQEDLLNRELKQSDSTSEDGDEPVKGNTIRVFNKHSSDSENETQKTIKAQKRNKLKTKKKKEPKIHIIGNQLIHSEAEYKDEVDSDSKSVVSVRRPLPFYSVSSDSECDDKDTGNISEDNERNTLIRKIKANQALQLENQIHKSLSDSRGEHQFSPRVSKSPLKHSRKRQKGDDSSSESSDNTGATTKKMLKPIKHEKIASKQILSQSRSKSQLQKEKVSSSESDSDSKENLEASYSNSEKINKIIAESKTSSLHQEMETVNKLKNKEKNNESSSDTEDDIKSSESNSPSDEVNKASKDISESNKNIDNEQPNDKVAMEEPEVPTYAELVEDFFQYHPDYKKTLPEMYDLSSVDSEDETYLLQIPKTFNPEMLKNVSFSLSKKKTKIKTESGKYVIRRQEEIPSTVELYTNKLKCINPKGILSIERYVKVKEPKAVLLEHPKKLPLPANIRVRHPLFGPNYEAKIQLEDQIREKLQEALKRFQVKEKKTKKTVKKEIKQEDDKNMLIAKILEEKFSSKPKVETLSTTDFSNINTEIKLEIGDYSEERPRKKKKKHSEETLNDYNVVKTENLEEFNPFNIYEVNDPIHDDQLNKKKKKKKIKIEKTLEESEINMEENVFDDAEITDENIRKKKKHKHYIAESSEENVLDTNIKRKKKKHKRSSESEELKTEIDIEESTELIKYEYEDFKPTTEDVNEFLHTDGDHFSEKKKKRKRSNSFAVSDIKKESEADNETQNEYDNDAPVRKKKKKAKKDVYSSSFEPE